MSEKLQLKPNDYLINEGDESTEMFFLQTGTLGVFKKKGEEEVQIGTIYAGEVVGEMSFLDKEKRSASVKAISEASVAVIPLLKFEKVLSDLPPWYTALIKTLLDRLRKANDRIRI